MKKKNKYPIFIPSKGRWESRHTVKMFDRYDIDYTVVIEKQEYENYASVIDPKKLLVLPFSNRGLTATRNWIWDYAEHELKVEKFWTFDDNMKSIYRLNRNKNIKCETGIGIRVVEDFTDRYENIGVAGMQYFMFIPRKSKLKPFTVNTRVYSNMLLKTKYKNPDGTPFRNNLFYNDDTDLNIRVLKKGDCTIQFNAFNIDKLTTMTVKGGLTENYNENGRLDSSKLIAEAHPDVATVSWKYGRWHHHVNYELFKKNKLILKSNIIIPKGINNYGLELRDIETNKIIHL